jgi:hypothetical protein
MADINGNTFFGVSERLHFSFTARITGWSDTSQGVVVKNRTDSSSVENVFSANITSTDTVSSENVDWIEGNCALSVSSYTCTFVSGLFSEIPACQATVEETSGGDETAVITALSTSSITVTLTAASSGAANTNDWHLMCQRQGDDYIKETDKVYTVPVNSITRDPRTQTLSANQTSVADISDLTFSNLEVGAEYRVSGMIYANVNAGGVTAEFRDGASGTGTVFHRSFLYDDDPSFSTISTDAISFTFVAAETSLYVYCSNCVAARSISGNGTRSQTYLQIERVDDRGIFLGNMSKRDVAVDLSVSGLSSTGAISWGTTAVTNGTTGNTTDLLTYANGTGTWTTEARLKCNVSSCLRASAASNINIYINGLVKTQGNINGTHDCVSWNGILNRGETIQIQSSGALDSGETQYMTILCQE